MRILAIGDIHGCLTALDTLLDWVAPAADDLLITLGDYVDRGPDSRGVLDRLIELYDAGRLIPLRGNHDVMMVNARAGVDWRLWVGWGGKQTLGSYRVRYPEAFDLDAIPDRHWAFLEDDLRDWYETGRHIFVHGTVEPDLPLDEQPTFMLHWEKLFESVAHYSGKVMVCGHTKQHSGLPLDLGSAICIDTGAYDERGWLTCLDVSNGRYWQANQRGQTREGRLD
jgi:serine/threonine protein phosphatase 1